MTRPPAAFAPASGSLRANARATAQAIAAASASTTTRKGNGPTPITLRPRHQAAPGMHGRLPRQARAVDHKPVLHVTLEHPLISLVDPLGPDQLDVRDDPVPGAEVQHLVRFRDAADPRAG